MFRITLLVNLMLFGVVCNTAASVPTGTGLVTQVHFWQGHTGLLVQHENMTVADSSCTAGLYILRKEHPFFTEIYSLILAAHISSQPLKFVLSGCHEGYSSIVHVYSNRNAS